MKRFLALLIACLTIFTAVSCANSTQGDVQSTTGEVQAPTTAPENISTPSDTEATFYAGYARTNISPDRFPIKMFGGTPAQYVYDDLYATVVAVSDGETTALFITLDLQSSSGTILTRTLNTAERYGIPQENVFVNVLLFSSKTQSNCKKHEKNAKKTPFFYQKVFTNRPFCSTI